MLSLDYDKKFDVLYIVLSDDGDSYGDESTGHCKVKMKK